MKTQLGGYGFGGGVWKEMEEGVNIKIQYIKFLRN